MAAYVGNNDFRGFLAAQPDGAYSSALTSDAGGNPVGGLGFVNNSGVINQPALNAWANGAAGNGQTGQQLADVTAANLAGLYKTFQGSQNPGAAPTGGGAAHPALNQGAVDNTQATIDQLPGLLQSALANEATSHQNTENSLNAQQVAQQGTYDTSTVNNQKNYDSSFMDSIRAGIKGLGGLVSLLRGNGAGGGTAEDQVRDVVGATTAGDIQTGANTQEANQTGLDGSLSAFLTDLSGKHQANQDTFVNNNRAINRDSATQLQDLYSKMAGFYGDAGNTGQRDSFMAKAGGLTPTIAANTKTQTSAYDTTPVAVKAAPLTAFAAPTQPNIAAAPQDGQVGSGIFSLGQDKRKDETAPVAPTAPQMAMQGA